MNQDDIQDMIEIETTNLINSKTLLISGTETPINEDEIKGYLKALRRIQRILITESNQ